ncbi:MAG: tRNA (adenosine(37)-N6)-threonylcarbamoyltransferase complex transferase subunit TsaD [Candidatus Pacebacteria bacterium]|nr:tRNA (adenosine(37)-N6)-threonylcarbamoyltransferase complex transferase subunit TsaD [Candidatus Paceibacterota bacterium]
MKILSIETSCDETAISILEAESNFNDEKNPPKFKILADNLISQADIHKKYGGVFPALAKREHSKNLVPLLAKTLTESKLSTPTTKYSLSSRSTKLIKETLEREPELLEQFLKFIPTIEVPAIDAIAVTQGPGLKPALWVGINFAKALSLVWNKPLIPVNHLEGHILASLVNEKCKTKKEKLKKVQFPVIGLLISGGHTELILMRGWMRYEKIGQTRDDAVGEAFDKVARMLNLPYPGGPEISKLAEIERKSLSTPTTQLSSRSTQWGDIEIKLPRPMLHTADFDFSFSGLKTAVLYLVKKLKVKNNWEDLPIEIKQKIAREFEDAVIEILLKKSRSAIKKYDAKTLILGGGVSANRQIRHIFQSPISTPTTKLEVLMPELEFATDNAVMIGVAGYFRYLTEQKENQKNSGQSLKAIARLNNLEADGNLNFETANKKLPPPPLPKKARK